MKEFVTANYRLEQFLYLHKVSFKYQRKNADLLTEWVYEDTPRLRQVVAEFREIWNP